jgi:hypothetical protein
LLQSAHFGNELIALVATGSGGVKVASIWLAASAGGLGLDRIAAQLNAEGLKTRTGAPWHGMDW